MTIPNEQRVKEQLEEIHKLCHDIDDDTGDLSYFDMTELIRDKVTDIKRLLRLDKPIIYSYSDAQDLPDDFKVN